MHLALDLAPTPPAWIPLKWCLLAYPRGRCSLLSLKIQLSHQSHWLDADCIGTVSHKDMPSTLGMAIVLLNFIETEEMKQNEHTDEYASNERTTTKES